MRQTKKRGAELFGVPLTLQMLLLLVATLVTTALVGLALLSWLGAA